MALPLGRAILAAVFGLMHRITATTEGASHAQRGCGRWGNLAEGRVAVNDATLEERMERLERENRRLKVGMLAVVAVVAGLVCIAATEPVAKVVRAERFEVVDAEGRVRAGLGLPAPPAAANLPRAPYAVDALAVLDGSPGLTLRDEKGKTRAGLMVSDDGSPSLMLLDETGKARAMLVVDHDGVGIALGGERGKQRALLGVSSDSGPVLQLRDDKGWVRAALGAYSLMTPDTGEVVKRAESSLVLFDKEGKVLWQAP